MDRKTEKDGGKKKIAIIEDDKDLVKLIKIWLEHKNFSVRFAYNGLAGLSLVNSDKPDLIILDIAMPRMDGREMLKKLKEEESTKDIPVIILTARMEEFEYKLLMKLGASKYITKPYEAYHLYKAISDLLGTQTVPT